MGNLYAAAIRSAFRQWPIVLALFAAHLAAGLLFAAVTWWWLAVTLDHSLATRTLLTDLDMNIFVDLLVHHRGSLPMLLVGAGLTAFGGLIVGVWLNAGAVIAVRNSVPLREGLHRGFDLFPRCLTLWVLTNLSIGAVVLAAFATARALARWTAESETEMTYYWMIGFTAVLSAGVIFFLTTVHDHARIRTAATGSAATSAYLWAIGFVARRQRRALVLAGLLLCTGLIGWAVYQTVAMLIAPHSALGVTMLLVWGEILLIGRSVLRIARFAGAAELQSAHGRA